MNAFLLIISYLLLSTIAITSLANPLDSFRSCIDLRQYLRDNGLSRVGSYGFGAAVEPESQGLATVQSQPEFQPSSFAPQTGPSEGVNFAPQRRPSEGVDFSGTNVQVIGVDEPDIIKTDGIRVFAIRQNRFYVVQVKTDGKTGDVVGSLTLPTSSRNMLIYRDSVLVIGTKYSRSYPVSAPVFRRRVLPTRTTTTVIYRISVAARAPKLVETLSVDGLYISGRSVDGTARIVTSFMPFYRFNFRYPSAATTVKNATNFNQERVAKSTETDWLPTYSLSREVCPETLRSCYTSHAYNRQLLPCSDVYYPKSAFSGFKVLSVLTIKINGPLIPRAVGIIADGSTIYATAKSLYAATTKYEFDVRRSPLQEQATGSLYTTSFHKFELLGSNAKYVGSGNVGGSVLNQFSMHEYHNTFFIATTDGAPWWRSRDLSSSKITAFEPTSRFGTGALQKVGEVGNLGKGERIYAVRYIGKVAYVVTFRQIDPLYIVDLSSTSNLRVTGELKIPGYSSYLHVVGDGRLLGVGREVTPSGRPTGAKVSLFDVSDVYYPKELSTWTLKGSYTNAEWDHRAFLYWLPEKIAVLPVYVNSGLASERFTGSIALSISEKSIEEKGRIAHSCCGSDYQRRIERNFIISRIHLWSISSKALQVNNVQSLAFESNIPL